MSKLTKADYQKFLDVQVSPTTGEIAREEAEKGEAEGGEPIGACVVHIPTGQILGRGRNQRMQQGSRIKHAETDALENVTLTGEPGGPPVPDNMLAECAMFTTLSACAMCSGACIQYGLKLVVMAENVHASGGEKILADHGVELVDMKDQACIDMFEKWIKNDAGRIWGNPTLATQMRRPSAAGASVGWIPS